jgi:hypothetical protein
MAVIFGFWAIIPVLFTYATSRISVTHQNIYSPLIFIIHIKEEINPTTGYKAQCESRHITRCVCTNDDNAVW